MTLLDNIVSFNEAFVNNHEYENYRTTKKPNLKAVLLTCMDTRLVELSTKALGFKNGDVKVVKNAGGTITHPYGATMRSLLVAIYALGAEEIIIMGHKDCGMGSLNVDKVLSEMKSRGIKEEVLEILEYSDIDVNGFLEGFNNVYDSVNNSIDMVYNHPLFDKNVPIHGLVIDPETGAIEVLKNGYTDSNNIK